ncbi:MULTISPECIES: PRC-barrel domain-containing protein [unclassified Bradyrhizobium]|uniref:PRC-barrel domain-containing protein n=1 Tax=unclassified Bradyrhizobium TaxID=2631580 RepID=UPI0028E33A7D|nr:MULTISPECIES: PRC-barrel domain-containing protein [unclassified Bradyrhizobium]
MTGLKRNWRGGAVGFAVLWLLLGCATTGHAQAPTAPAKDAAVPAKEPAPPPSVTILGARDAHGVLGRDVRSSNGEDMGHIVDVIVDLTGTVRAAVIDFGGFLGVGSRKIVVDWTALDFKHIAEKSDRVTLDLTKEQVKAAPEYKEDKPVVVLGAAGKLSPWDFDH